MGCPVDIPCNVAAEEGHERLDRSFTKIFLGPAGTVTRLHNDTYYTHAWLSQIRGTKQFILYPPRRHISSMRARASTKVWTIMEHHRRGSTRWRQTLTSSHARGRQRRTSPCAARVTRSSSLRLVPLRRLADAVHYLHAGKRLWRWLATSNVPRSPPAACCRFLNS